MPYWPEASHGKAIITTRNHSLVYDPATYGLEITSWDAQTGSEFLLFLLKGNIGSDIHAEGDSAIELSRKLGGHALALSHMAGLIHRRSWSIAEFMRIYSKNPRRAHQSELQAVWDLSFATLGQDSRVFLGVASFLVSENIPQLLFDVGGDSDLPEDLAFCTDEFRYGWSYLERDLSLTKAQFLRGNRTPPDPCVDQTRQRCSRVLLPSDGADSISIFPLS